MTPVFGHGRLRLYLLKLPANLISMGLAGTDYALHRRFTEATSRYRETFVQTLNASNW